MTHYYRVGKSDLRFSVEMGCSHPSMKDNSTESVGCNGQCETCSYGAATLTIRDFMRLAMRAKCSRD